MRYYPINMDIRDRQVVVIGAGRVAGRKVATLLDAGAKVRIISPAAEDEIVRLRETGTIEWLQKPYQPGDLDGAQLVFVAVNDRNVGEAVVKEALERGVPVNVADIPDLCTFTLPSVAERGDLMIAVSTAGKCPALAREVRLRIEETIDEAYASLLDLLSVARVRLIEAGVDSDKCRVLLNNLIASDMLSEIRAGRTSNAGRIADEAVKDYLSGHHKKI